MMRSLGWNWRRAACVLACLFATCGQGMAQPPEHWQPAQNYPANNPPNYQPSNVPADPQATGYPPAGDPAAGQNRSGNGQIVQVQGGQVQGGQVPGGQVPGGQVPGGQVPGGQVPGGQVQGPPYQPSQSYPSGQPNPQYPQYPSNERQGPPAGPQGYGGPLPGNALNPAGNPASNPPAYAPLYPQVRVEGPSAAGQPMQGPPVRYIAPKAPFVLSPEQTAALDRLLTDWEKRNKEIQVLESKFYRWKYDAVFGNGNQPPPCEEGELKFAAPDKGLMLLKAKDPNQCEQWLCDGKSIFQFDYPRKRVTEYVMPPELQGKGIGDGPLPFVFGIEAEKLKQRYFMRIITPPNVQNAVWLEAYPRYQQQAAEFSKVEVILQITGTTRSLLPYAIQIYAPNGKDRVVYQLQDPKINPRIFLGGAGGIFFDWTKVSIPFGWEKKVELPPPPIQAGLSPSAGQRR
jgi:TIGR03009 family protein